MEPINIWNCKVVETRKNIYINNTCNLVPNKNVHIDLLQNYAHMCNTTVSSQQPGPPYNSTCGQFRTQMNIKESKRIIYFDI